MNTNKAHVSLERLPERAPRLDRAKLAREAGHKPPGHAWRSPCGSCPSTGYAALAPAPSLSRTPICGSVWFTPILRATQRARLHRILSGRRLTREAGPSKRRRRAAVWLTSASADGPLAATPAPTSVSRSTS